MISTLTSPENLRKTMGQHWPHFRDGQTCLGSAVQKRSSIGHGDERIQLSGLIRLNTTLIIFNTGENTTVGSGFFFSCIFCQHQQHNVMQVQSIRRTYLYLLIYLFNLIRTYDALMEKERGGREGWYHRLNLAACGLELQLHVKTSCNRL